MNFKISVVVPIYGVEEYVEVSLRSIFEQEFNDFEIIIVNDGTKDNSMNIVNNVVKDYKIDYKIINQQNSGLPSARNTGLKNATGKYICFIDSDDVLDRNYLNNHYRLLESTDIKISFCDFEETHLDNRLGNKIDFTSYKIYNRDTLLDQFVKRRIKIHCCSLVIDREFLIANNFYFNEGLRYGEDVEFMWNVLPSQNKIGRINAPLYKYLQREGSLMSKQDISNVKRMVDALEVVIKNQSSNYPELVTTFNNVVPRVMLGGVNSFTIQSDSFDTFIKLLEMLNFKRNYKKLLNFPDMRVKLLAVLLIINPKIYYHSVKKINSK